MSESVTPSPAGKREREEEEETDAGVERKRSRVEVVDNGHNRKAQVPLKRFTVYTGSLMRLTRVIHASEEDNRGCVTLAGLVNTVRGGPVVRAVVTTYKVDLPWFVSQCEALYGKSSIAHVSLVHGERGERLEDLENEWRELGLHTRENLVSMRDARMPIPYGTNHGKLLVLATPQYIRVAITTANLLEIDYACKSQGVWCQDFPAKPTSSSTNATSTSSSSSSSSSSTSSSNDYPFGGQPTELAEDFVCTLRDYFEHMGEGELDFLDAYDYGKVRVALVACVPGLHEGNAMHRYGHLRVRSLLRKYGPRASTQATLTCQVSSFGALSDPWLKDFASSMGVEAYNMQVLWPSVDYVRKSLPAGWEAGHSLCGPVKNLARKCVQNILRKYQSSRLMSSRARVSPHIKTFSRRSASFDEDGCLDWLILTSCNMSKAAWGELQGNGARFRVPSFEMGVLFLPSLLGSSLQVSDSAHIDAQTQTIHVPLPYELRAPRFDIRVGETRLVSMDVDMMANASVYGDCLMLHQLDQRTHGDVSHVLDNQPWTWDTAHLQPDIHGRFFRADGLVLGLEDEDGFG